MGNRNVQIIFSFIDKISRPMREVVDKMGQAAEQARKMNAAVKPIKNSIDDLKSRLDRMTVARNGAFREDHIRKYNGMIRQTQRELQRLENLPPRGFMNRMRELPSMLSGMAKGIGIAFVATKIIQFGSNVVKATADVEKYKLTLETMLGSKSAADSRMGEYQDIAAKTPFELQDVVELGNGLQSLGRYSRQNVMMLGDLAAAAGKPLDQVRGAYAKLGTGQKGEAVNMFRDLLISTDDWVKATGKGVSKNGELMATTEEMIAALPRIMDAKNFEGMMDKQSQGIWGRISNLKDTLFQFMAGLGDLLKPLIDGAIWLLTKLSEGLSGLLKFLQDNKDLISSIAIGIGVATIAWGAYKLMLLLTSATTYASVIPAIKAIGLAIYNIPIIGWIAALIAALVALGVYFWKTSATFRGVLMGMWEAVKAIFGGIGDFMMEVLGGVKDVILAVFNPANWFDGEDQMGAALDRIKNAASKYGKAISEGYNKGKKAGLASFEKDQEKKKQEDGGLAPDSTTLTGDDPSGVPDVGSVTSGGSRPVNVTLNLGKLMDNVIINAANVKEGAQDIEKIIVDTMLRVVNSANAVQAGGGS
ncbi:MAG: hypothetical protein RBS07_07795 [Lentimicrobium sp.]|jgi:hypothetical protein|nr:hypothetical protein [Lentimicrobium sp.]